MKKSLLFMMILLIGGLFMSVENSVSITLSYNVNSATNFLEIRPNSDKSNNELTRTQLISFLGTVTAEVNSAITGLYDIDQALVTSRLETLTALLDGLTDAQFNAEKAFYYSLYESLFELYSYCLESRSVEGRGMWHRPFESNLTQVRETLQSLSDMGINMLYVETFWMGRLIYDSQVPDTYQHFFTSSGYRDDTVDYGTNLLKAFIEEGKTYGIEVHAWVENFFVGYGTSYTDSPILKVHPEWASYNYDGTIPQKREVNYLFMDPANPETRDYLKAIYGEIATTMDVASIHLDYIRYPVAQNVTNPLSSNQDTGYSAYAEREFKSIYGYTGDLRTLVITNPSAAADWQEYKTQVISDFVAGVYYTVKTLNPDVYLSTAIFGNINSALTTKMQDWASWIEDGYVELILPMAYYQSSITVRSEVTNLTNIVDKNAFSYAGIAPSFMGYNDHLNTTQIRASLDARAMGATFFASQNYLVHMVDGTNNFNTKVQQILQNGVYRNTAINPHGDTREVVDEILYTILDKANRIYVPNSVMTVQQQTDLTGLLDTLKTYPLVTKTNLDDLISALESITVTNYASGVAVTRIEEDLQYLIDILTIKSKRMTFDETIDITVNPDQNTYFEDPITLTPPTNISLTDFTLSWDSVEHSTGYIVNVNGTPYTASSNEFDIRNASFIAGTNIIGVKTIGDGVVYESSDYGTVVEHIVTKLYAPTNVRIEDNILYFEPVPGATEYYLKVGIKTRRFTTTEYDLSTLNLGDGVYTIDLKTIGDGYLTVDSNYHEDITYKSGTASIESIFGTLFNQFIQQSIRNDQED